MNSLRFHETDLHGPFRHKIQVTHENHGVVDWVLNALIPRSLYSIDKSNGGQGSKAQIVNEVTGNAFRLALGTKMQQHRSTFNELGKFAAVTRGREMKRGGREMGKKGPSNQDTHTLCIRQNLSINIPDM